MAEKPLDHDLEAEVLIIGMGISGAMTADLLTEAGHDVVMIVRRGPAKGSTPATTALVQFEIDVLFGEFRSKIGTAKADQAWRRSRLR